MLLLEFLALSGALFIYRVTAGTNLTWTGYCPFDIKLAPSDDPKSLDVTYTPTTTPVNTFMLDGKACLIEISFSTPDLRGDVYLEEIEYISNKNMAVETKIAWRSAFGPTLYDRISITGPDTVTAHNATWNTFPFCIQQPHSYKEWSLYLQTKFSDVAVGPDFRLEQKARLRWGENNYCTVMPECDEPDIDMKFMSCHDIPGGHYGDGE